jgi:release factor glutamine methyltransferase
MMNLWLTKSTRQLEAAGIGTARLDALVLLEDITGKDRTHLLAHPELELTIEQQNHLQKLLDRRATHEPLAYIREKTEFYGRELFVNSSVLEPRPESETIIELLKKQTERQSMATIIDLGTGSGALAITAKLDIPQARVLAVDIDTNCLKVATKNAQQLHANIEFIHGSLLEAFFDVELDGPVAIMANLPYVPDNYQINAAASNEPKLAIFGGPDGLDLYRTMFEQLDEYFDQQVFVFTESLPFQHTELMNIAATHSFKQVAEVDFIQVFS